MAGQVLFGTDSHTCNGGAFGQFATGIGNTDASFVMGTGKLLIKSPASMQFALEGEMADHILAKVRRRALLNALNFESSDRLKFLLCVKSLYDCEDVSGTCSLFIQLLMPAPVFVAAFSWRMRYTWSVFGRERVVHWPDFPQAVPHLCHAL